MKLSTFIISLTLFSLLITLPCKAEVYTDYEICRTKTTGCVKCTDDDTNFCLVCREGLMVKSFTDLITESQQIEEIGGYCVSGINIYDSWHQGIYLNESNTTNITVEQIDMINDANYAKKFINYYLQIFNETSVYPTLDTLERITMATKVKTQLLEKLNTVFMPIKEIEDAKALIYGFKSTLQTEYRLFTEIGFVPQSLKNTVIDDINLIIKALEEIKADFSDDSYIAYQGLAILNQIMQYYELKVLDYDNLSENIKLMLIKEEEEWGYSGGYFPNGIPSSVDQYVLELLEEHDLSELYEEEEYNQTQNEVHEAILNLVTQYSGYNWKKTAINFDFSEFSLNYLFSQSTTTTLSTKTITLTLPSDYFSVLQDQNNIDVQNDVDDEIEVESQWHAMLLLLVYKHVNTFGDNPDSKSTDVGIIQGYQIRLEDNDENSQVVTELEKIAVRKELYFPDQSELSIEFKANTGNDEWECIKYSDQEWKVNSNTTELDLARIGCKVEKFGSFGYQRVIAEDNATWANIGMHASWFWLAFVALICAAKVFLYELFNQQQIEENQGKKDIKFSPFTISMPVSIISAVGWGDIAYKCLFMLVYFSILSVSMAYNIQENSDDEYETWMDFYTAFRVLIIAWILKYFFGSLRIIQNDCFQNPAPLSIVLIISYFVGMYFCQRELSSASNDRQEQWLISLVVAIVMDLVIDFLLAIIIVILPQSIKKVLLTGMRLGGFVTFAKPQAYQLGYIHPEENIQKLN